MYGYFTIFLRFYDPILRSDFSEPFPIRVKISILTTMILIVFAIIAIVILYLILLGIKDNSRMKNRQIYLGYLQLKNDTSHFCLDYIVHFKRQISHYSMFLIFIAYYRLKIYKEIKKWSWIFCRKKINISILKYI